MRIGAKLALIAAVAGLLALPACESGETVTGPDAPLAVAMDGATVTPWRLTPPLHFTGTPYWACFGEAIDYHITAVYRFRSVRTPSGNFNILFRPESWEGTWVGMTSGDPYVQTRYHLSENWHNLRGPVGFFGHFTEFSRLRNERTGQEAEVHFVVQAAITPGGMVFEPQNILLVCMGP